jgi:hypothetical protein
MRIAGHYDGFLDFSEGALIINGLHHCAEEVGFWTVSGHVLLLCHPGRCEAEPLLLEVKLEELERLH